MKVGFVSADWSDIPDPETGFPSPGGSCWYRVAMPALELAKNGIETVQCELISLDRSSTDRGIWLHDFGGQVHDDCDVVVLQRWMGEEAPEVIRHARKSGQIVVNDIDDWYWGLSTKNAAFKAIDPKLNPECNKDHYAAAIAASDAAIVSTEFLEQKISRLNRNCHVIRNAIDLHRWKPQEVPEDPANNIGWVGSTFHRSGDLETLRGVLGPLVKSVDGTFIHAGVFGDAVHAGILAGVEESRLRTRPGCSIFEYPTLFEGIDVGIVPLYDMPFNHAKSYIKGVEYAAAGVPFIAQDTPEYRFLRDEYGVGYTAKRAKDWIAKFRKLQVREERVQAVEQNLQGIQPLDIRLRWKEWADLFYSLSG
jgi:hypothetical protein